jgi:hypothetical protein
MQAKVLKLKVKKVIDRGEKYYKLLSFECYKEYELPHKYFDKYPYCYMEDNLVFVNISNKEDDNYAFKLGDFVDEATFDKLIKVLRVCGEKLHNLNQEIKQLKVEWKGEEEVKI